MRRLISHLFPNSLKVGYNVTLVKLFKTGICGFSRFPDVVNHCSYPCLTHILYNLIPSKYLHSTYHHHQNHELEDGDGGLAESEESSLPFLRTIEIEEYSEQFRKTLYPTSSDPILVQLNGCNSSQQLIQVLEDNAHLLQPEHNCQFILVLWDISKQTNLSVSLVSNDQGLYTYKNSVSSENVRDIYYPVLLKSLNLISDNLEKLTPEALVCSVLYSNRLGVDLKNLSLQTLLVKINELLVNGEEFTLSALSRLTITLVDKDELWAKMLLIKTLPLIYKYFDSCNNAEDFRALTISMLSTVPYLREDLLVEYEALTEELLMNGTLTRSHTSIIVKAMLLLNNIYYRPIARHKIYKLFQLLSGGLHHLFIPHLLDMQKIVWMNVEPNYTKTELEILKQKFSSTFLDSSDFFPYYFQLITVPSNSKGSLFLKSVIGKVDRLDALLCMQGQLNTCHGEACQLFWAKVCQLLDPRDFKAMLSVCLRYMNFKERMGSYRHLQFESHMLSLITTELVNRTVTMQPRAFAQLSSFVVAFEHHNRAAARLSDNVVPRLLSIMGQLDAQSCLLLSRGLKLGMLYQRNEQLQMYLRLDSALTDRTRELMEIDDEASISMFNTYLRSCINREGSAESGLMWDLLRRCELLDWSQLTSRSLRNLVYNLQVTRGLVPSALDHMVEYCLDNRLYVTADTAGKLAFLAYYLGYTPTYATSFCALTADLVARDWEQLNGLSFLQVALALSFFHHLPSSINQLIFNVTFLERLDLEIKNCFSKDKYPLRVRKNLMQLNRSVCLDQPEADVPWFHSKFCEEQLALGRKGKQANSLLFTDVLNTLVTLVGGVQYVGTQTTTPYGYTIDIQLNLDNGLNPVPFKDQNNASHKLALLLYYPDCYTRYERRLKGFYLMKQRHLEILGYKVIGLSDSEWNAMYMSEPPAKFDCLRKLIWPL